MAGESRRGLAFPFISRGVAEGMSSEAIIKALRETGLSYRRQDMLADIRSVREGAKVREEFRTMTPDTPVDPDRYAMWEWNIKEPYLYQVALSVTDRQTGKTELQYYGVLSDRVLTRREAEEIATSAMAAMLEAYNKEVKRGVLSNVFVKTK